MKSDINTCAQLGADGVVFGCLKMDGRVDVQLTEQLLAIAKQHVSLVEALIMQLEVKASMKCV